jgi:hypothetical protein
VELHPRICGNDDCLELYVPKVHNAVYCSAKCRKIITNQKVLDKYHQKKLKQRKEPTVCSTSTCDTILSKYNEENICGACQVVRLKNRLEGWGWDRSKLDEEWKY